MKQLKRIPIQVLVVVFLFIINRATAQSLDSLKQSNAELLTKKSSVNHEVALKIAEINIGYKNDVKECVKNQSLSAQAKKEKLSQLLNEKNQKLKGLLTTQQMAQITAGSHMIRKHRQAGTDSLNNKNGNRKLPVLNLDKKTQALAEQINENYKNGVNAVKNNTALSEKAKREKMDALAIAKRSQLSQILTPVQLAMVSPGGNAQARRADSIVNKSKLSQISNLISVDDKTAEKVVRILNNSSETIKNIGDDTRLSNSEKQIKSKQAAEAKRAQLATFLTPSQVNKLVPPEIVAPVKGFSNADISKYPETAAVQDTFNIKMKLLMANKALTEQQRRSQTEQLIKERNASLNRALGKRIQSGLSITN